MILKRIKYISGVGRFHGISQKGPELKKYNLIFAANGSGKTTLCAIFRSLQTLDPVFIQERRTLGAEIAPEVILELNCGLIKYRNAEWVGIAPKIAIFDSAFVSQSVHAGDYIDKIHRKRQLEVIIGETGVALKKRINEIDGEIFLKEEIITNTKDVLRRALPKSALPVERFIYLQRNDAADEYLIRKRETLKAAEKSREILSNPSLVRLRTPRLPRELGVLLQSSIEDVAQGAEQMINDHLLAHNMSTGGRAWLASGVQFSDHTDCPFCGQELRSRDLIRTYKAYFSEKYQDLVQSLRKVERDILAQIGEAERTILHVYLERNRAASEFWRQHFTYPEFDEKFADQLKVLSELEAMALELVRKKLDAPLNQFYVDERFLKTAALAEEIYKAISKYNDIVAVANDRIRDLKSMSANSEDLVSLREEVSRLEFEKSRDSGHLKDLCETILEAEKLNVSLDTERRELESKLKVHSSSMMSKYVDGINEYLKRFGTDFQIASNSSDDEADYHIKINGHPISVGDDKATLGQPSFRNTLSTGDKSALALAFFLSQIDGYSDKQNIIVIFDDPFSSQDRSRRTQTARLLERCGRIFGQVALLSHDPNFLSEFYDMLPRDSTSCHQMVKTGKQTVFNEWDISRELLDAYFKQYAELSDFVNNYLDLDTIHAAQMVRPLLEAHLWYRFPGDFHKNSSLGKMIEVIREWDSEHPMQKSLPDLEAINYFGSKYHHKNAPVADYDEVKAHAQMALHIIKGY